MSRRARKREEAEAARWIGLAPDDEAEPTRCHECGEAIPDGDTQCPRCGAEVQE